jgi:phage terminase Nu1 subunit (DNA packaging protein)
MVINSILDQLPAHVWRQVRDYVVDDLGIPEEAIAEAYNEIADAAGVDKIESFEDLG